LVEVVKEAKAKGIPIINFNTPDPQANFDAYVGGDNKTFGKNWAQYLVDKKLVKSGDFVWMPVEVPGATYGVQEEEGIASVFKPLNITWEVTDATLDQAEIITRMSDYLTANRSKIKAIIGLGDLVNGSIKRVFDQVGVKAGEIPVVGWGNSTDTTQEVLNGYVNAAQWQDPQATSYMALSMAAMAASKIPPLPTQTGCVTRFIPGDAAQPVNIMQQRTFLHSFVSKPEFGPLVLLVLELVIFWSFNSDFLSLPNISNTLSFTVELGLIALAMTLLMTAGEFDLSVGSVFGFSAVLMWTLFNSEAMPLGVAFLVAIAFSLFIGFINGWFVTKLNIPSFLVTLGMLLVVRGTALYVTDGFPQRTWTAGGNWFANLLAGSFFIGSFRMYMSVIWFALAAFVAHYILTKSKTGNWIQASGGNPNAARARGVNVSRTKIYLFMASSAMASLAGIISSIRTSAANPNSGTGYELEVIAMVVIGGTVLTGGRGTIIGTVLGIFILRVMRNGIVMVGVPGLAYNIFIGAIILGMMALHSWLERRHNAGV
jgi:simple sugar transport system permease protein